MSKQTHNDSMVKGNETFYARSGQQGVDKRRKLWQEYMKRKEEAAKPEEAVKPEEKDSPKVSQMDKWYKGASHQNAKSMTALYLAVANKKVHWPSVKENYDLGISTCQRYQAWYNSGLFNGNSDRINKHVLKNRKKLVEAMKQSPSPTIVEVNRLYGLAFPNNYDTSVGVIRTRGSRSKKDHVEDYDHMLNDKQKGDLIDLANLELSEIKPVTKSDVVVGVITGALVGGAMVAYAFLTNGAI